MVRKGNKLSNYDIKFSNEKIGGNTATLDAEITKTKDKSTVHFVKEEGNWKLCKGILDKMDEGLNNNGLLYYSINGGRKLDLDKSFDKIKEVMNDPKTRELINYPEMKERMKKTMEAMKAPKKIVDLQKSIESMKQ